MAFPTTGLIDNFNRANEAPIASPWVNSIYSGDAQMNLTTNALQRSGSGWGSAYYGSTTYGPDCENYVTIAAVGASDGLEIAVRVTNGDTTTPNGYFLHIAGSNGTWQFWKMTSGSQSTVGTSVDPAFAVAVGDQIGVEIIGNTLTAYHKPSGGSWSLIFSRTDSTSPHTGAGNLGFLVQSNSWRLDDFSGGTIVSGTDSSYSQDARVIGRADSSRSQDVRTTGDFAFGHFAIGETPQAVGANYPFGNVHTVPVNAQITKIRAYLDNPADANAQVLRAVVYPASGGAPVNGGVVKGTSSEVNIPDGAAGQWFEFTFPTPVAVTANEQVVLGLWGGSVSNAARLYEITANPTPNVNYYFNNGGYSSVSSPNNWNTAAGGSTADIAWSLYAVYQPTSESSSTQDVRVTGVDHTVLDNFNRADANPITGSWANFPRINTPRLRTVGNQVAGQTGVTSSDYYTGSQFDSDGHVGLTAVTLPTNVGERFEVFLRAANPTLTTATGYRLRVARAASGWDWSIWRLDSGASVSLATLNAGLAAGDKIWFRAEGNLLRAYRYNSSVWSQVVSYDTTPDATKYSNDGYIGMALNGDAARADDFFGWPTSGTDSSHTQDARVTGRADSSQAQDVRTVGRADSSHSQDSRVTGRADSTHAQDARITGRADSTHSQDARLIGRADSSHSQDGRVTGRAESSLATDVRITGAPLSGSAEIAYDARVIGRADSADSRDIRIRGQQDSTFATDVRTTGRADTVQTYDVRVRGRADSLVAYDARVRGRADSVAQYDVRITGRLDAAQAVEARVIGVAPASLDVAARVTGQLASATSADVRVYGILTANTAFDVRVVGVPPLTPPPIGGRGAGLITPTRRGGLVLQPRGGGIEEKVTQVNVGQPSGGGLIKPHRHVRTT